VTSLSNEHLDSDRDVTQTVRTTPAGQQLTFFLKEYLAPAASEVDN
jgi:hypothetical protein